MLSWTQAASGLVATRVREFQQYEVRHREAHLLLDGPAASHIQLDHRQVGNAYSNGLRAANLPKPLRRVIAVGPQTPTAETPPALLKAPGGVHALLWTNGTSRTTI